MSGLRKLSRSRFIAKPHKPLSHIYQKKAELELDTWQGFVVTVSPADLRVYKLHYSFMTCPWPSPGSPLGWILEDLAQEVLATGLRVTLWWCDGTRRALIPPMSWSPFDFCLTIVFPHSCDVWMSPLLLPQMDEVGDFCQPPQPGSHGNGRMRSLTRVALSALGATFLLLLYKAASGKVYLHMYRNVC